jgi:hypothetical protein
MAFVVVAACCHDRGVAQEEKSELCVTSGRFERETGGLPLEILYDDNRLNVAASGAKPSRWSSRTSSCCISQAGHVGRSSSSTRGPGADESSER